MTEEEKPKPNVYDILDKMAERQTQQQTQIDQLTKAIGGLAEALSQKSGQPVQQGGGEFIALLKELAGGGKQGQQASLKQITEAAAYFARLADVVDHYRHPSLPYSGGDKFLMKAGARYVYRNIYEGVKTREGKEVEQPNEQELDKMLGFVEPEEKTEEEKKKHGVKV